MILYIDTTLKSRIILKLLEDGLEVAHMEEEAPYMQAEKLLPALEKILKKNKFKLQDIKKIEVNNDGGTFTSLRIGVTTANALAFALKIPIKGTSGKPLKKGNLSIIKPKYNAEPKIN